MPLLEAFELPGCRCWFYSDDHRPAHFHVKSPGEWELRVFFLQEPPRVEEVFSIKKVPGNTRRAIIQLVRKNRAALLTEWTRKVHLEDLEE